MPENLDSSAVSPMQKTIRAIEQSGINKMLRDMENSPMQKAIRAIEQSAINKMLRDMENSPMQKAIRAIEQSGINKMLRDLENSPMQKTIRAIEQSGINKMLRDFEISPMQKTIRAIEQSGINKMLRDLENSPMQKAIRAIEQSGINKMLQDLENSPMQKTIRAIEQSGINKMLRDLGNSPMQKTIRAIEQSGINKMLRDLENSPMQKTIRAIEQSAINKMLRQVQAPSDQNRLGPLASSTELQALSGIRRIQRTADPTLPNDVYLNHAEAANALAALAPTILNDDQAAGSAGGERAQTAQYGFVRLVLIAVLGQLIASMVQRHIDLLELSLFPVPNNEPPLPRQEAIRLQRETANVTSRTWPEATQLRVVTAKSAPVSRSRKPRAPRIARLPSGTVVLLVDKKRDQALVAWFSGDLTQRSGWIRSKYLGPLAAKKTAAPADLRSPGQ